MFVLFLFVLCARDGCGGGCSSVVAAAALLKIVMRAAFRLRLPPLVTRSLCMDIDFRIFIFRLLTCAPLPEARTRRKHAELKIRPRTINTMLPPCVCESKSKSKRMTDARNGNSKTKTRSRGKEPREISHAVCNCILHQANAFGNYISYKYLHQKIYFFVFIEFSIDLWQFSSCLDYK